MARLHVPSPMPRPSSEGRIYDRYRFSGQLLPRSAARLLVRCGIRRRIRRKEHGVRRVHGKWHSTYPEAVFSRLTDEELAQTVFAPISSEREFNWIVPKLKGDLVKRNRYGMRVPVRLEGGRLDADDSIAFPLDPVGPKSSICYPVSIDRVLVRPWPVENLTTVELYPHNRSAPRSHLSCR